MTLLYAKIPVEALSPIFGMSFLSVLSDNNRAHPQNK